MCMTFSLATLARTKLYAGEAKLGGKYVHVIAYQNEARSAGPNAMILPIPAAAPLTEQNVIDTRSFAGFLDDIHWATKLTRWSSPHESRSSDALPRVRIFNVGSYTVVLAARPAAIASVLALVPEGRRPEVNPAMLQAFDELYPGWPLAVCCWSGKIRPEPLLWWYEPKMPDWLFAPALDAHDGGPPDLHADVKVHHHIAFGSTLDPFGNEVNYATRPPGIARDLLPTHVLGARITGRMPNGDLWRSAGIYNGPALRCSPPVKAPPDGLLAQWAARLRRTCPATKQAEISLHGWH
ncbi:Hypothetical protein A7982_04246 [Minicystis rosea]|nr:Hypothetical protein A7982_04246 [Minicystis rosea]